MAEDQLFRRLCDPDLIEIGWHLAHGDSRDDFATDPFSYADYAFLKADRFRFIVEQLKNDRYRVGRLTQIDIPKTGLSVRPGNVLPIEEATILNAIVYLIAPKIDPKLRDEVYSYRLAKDWPRRAAKAESLFKRADVNDIPFLKRRTIRSISIEEPWYEAWPEFDEAGINAFRQEGFTHLTKTDITAYFENIDLQLLGSMLRGYLPRERMIIEILMRILHSWTRRTPAGIPIGRGIPQGNNVSSFLGNLYLAPLDRLLVKFARQKQVTWFRYVDDIKVFTKTFSDAREAVFLINAGLRELHLNLQGGKTEILYGAKLETELFDSELHQINGLIDRARKLGTGNGREATKIVRESHKVTKRFTRNLPESLTSLSGQANRRLRRCFTLFGILRRPQLRKTAIGALEQIPDLRMLRSTLGYLAKLDYKYHEKVVTDLFALLTAKELPFPYQIAVTVEAIGRMAPFDPRRLGSRLREIGLTAKADWYLRQKTLEAILHLPYREESAEKLVLGGLEHPNPWVRRAACALVPRGRVTWILEIVTKTLVYHPDPEVARIGLYWQRHLEDEGVANREMTAVVKAGRLDVTFLRRVKTLYLLRCNARMATRLAEYLTEFSKSPNSVVRWHCENILRALPSIPAAHPIRSTPSE
jgi:hypothetical protein